MRDKTAKLKKTTKDRKIIMTIAAAAVLTLLFGVLLVQFLAPRRTTVYVFKSSYNAGTALSEEMISPMQVDSKIVIAGNRYDAGNQYVTAAEMNKILKKGDSLRVEVSKGMTLTTSMLTTAGGTSVEANMNKSSIAVTVPVTNTTGVTKEIKPGTYVNVYASTEVGTSLLYEKMRVLEVYRSNGDLNGVSLETNQEQSMKLIYSAKYGEIHLGIVDGSGYQFNEGQNVYKPGN